MMDVSRFGMEYNPFLKNSKEVLVETAQYREVLFWIYVNTLDKKS